MTESTTTIPGFQPRSGVRPFWLHTMELDPDGDLVSVVVVIDQQYLRQVGDAIGSDDARMLVHQLGREVWLRLTAAQMRTLHSRMSGMVDSDPRKVPDAVRSLSAAVYWDEE